MTVDTAAAPVTPPIEVVTPIKPSEAIRLGRLLRPNRTPMGVMFAPNAACVLGAMLTGYGLDGGDVIAPYDLITSLLAGAGLSPLRDFAFPYDDGGTDEDAIALLESLGL